MFVPVGRMVDRVDAIGAKRVAAALVVLCGLAALSVVLSAGNCNAWFAIPGLCRSSTAVLVAVGVAALPIAAFGIVTRPLATLLALYIVLLPLDDALIVNGGFTITKLLGLAVAAAGAGRLITRRRRIRVPYAILGWGAVLGFMTASILWGIDPSSSTQQLVTIFSAFALLLILVAVPMDAVDLRAIIYATIASGAVVGLIAIILARQEVSQVAGQAGRLYLTFGASTFNPNRFGAIDPNRFGASLLLPIAVTVGAIGQTRGWLRAALFVALALTCSAIYLSASRGTMLALLAMALVAILSSRHRFVLGVLLAASVSFILVIPSEITRRLYAEGTAASGTGRVDIWRVAVEIFRNHWLLGTGVGTFIPAYNRAFFLAYQPHYVGWGRDPHSLLLSTATELGVVGLALMTVALVLQYRSARLIGPNHPYPWLRTVFCAAFIGLLVAAFFVDLLSTKFAWLLFTEMLVFAGIVTKK